MSVAATPARGDRIAGLHGAALWTITGLVLYVLVGMGSLFLTGRVFDPILGAVGLVVQAGEPGLSIRNGLHAVVWGLLTAVVAMPFGRRLVDGVRFSAAGWIVLVIGLVIATVAITLGAEFVRSTHGVYDPEYEGLTLFTGPALVAVALAAWAALAVPRAGVLAPAGTLLAAGAGLVLSLLPSIPGATDGVAAAQLLLLAAFVAGVAYTAAVSVMVLARLRPSA
jgi:hypothetical protein